MQYAGSYLLLMVLLFVLPISSCGQSYNGTNNSSNNHYVGSTPCDSLIKLMMGIPTSDPCEFMKWRLDMAGKEGDSFYLSVRYGMTEPNTNGFHNGGTERRIQGKYSIEAGKASAQSSRIYYFNSADLAAPLILVELENGIFHFADKNFALLVGNGGWGYVLNKASL